MLVAKGTCVAYQLLEHRNGGQGRITPDPQRLLGG